MGELRTCDQCGRKATSYIRKMHTPQGEMMLCWECRDERNAAYKAADALKRNAANRAKAKLIKIRGRFCQQCGRYMQMVVGHHLLPVRLGGTEEPNNLLLLCEDCHHLEHASGTRY